MKTASDGKDGEKDQRENGDPIRMWPALINLINSNTNYWRAQAQQANKPETYNIGFWTMIAGIAALGGVFVACAAAGIFFLQLRAMSGQLKEMHDGGVDTHNLALAAKLDQRAWIGFALLTLDPPKIGDVLHASVTYVDTGKTPAKNVSPFTHLKFRQSLISTEAELLKVAEEGGSPAPIIGVMYQNMPYLSAIEGHDRFNDINLKEIGDLYAYLWGEVAYTDVFEDRHTMKFCAYRKVLEVAFLECPFHNDPGYETSGKQDQNPN